MKKISIIFFVFAGLLFIGLLAYSQEVADMCAVQTCKPWLLAIAIIGVAVTILLDIPWPGDFSNKKK